MRRALILIAVMTLARVAYLIWWSPYELVADEAQYWDWSRRLSASYYSKGPGVAWAIALSTRLFGVAEWSVRLPAAIASAVVAAAAARLAIDFAPPAHAARAGLAAALLVNLVPAYQLCFILMTIDAPYLACWAAAASIAWRAYCAEREGRPSVAAWVACGAAIGVGFLFKYSMVLLIPGLAAFAWRERHRLSSGVGTRAMLALAAVAAVSSPVFWWNAQHHGAGAAHLLGFIASSGGDRPVRPALQYDPRWTIAFVAGQLAVIGPVLGVVAAAVRRDRRRDGVRFAIACAAPMLLAFFFATFKTKVEANWPTAAYITLLAIAAGAIAESTATRRAQTLIAGYGAVALIGVHAPFAAAALPGVGRYVPVARFHGAAAAVERLSTPIERFMNGHGHGSLIVVPMHNVAGLLAFYLPGHPIVASAGRFFGNRPSAYDFFDDTNLAGPQTIGRPALLVGATERQWSERFVLKDVVAVWPYPPVFAAAELLGPRSGAPLDP